MRISNWSSDVCSSDLLYVHLYRRQHADPSRNDEGLGKKARSPTFPAGPPLHHRQSGPGAAGEAAHQWRMLPGAGIRCAGKGEPQLPRRGGALRPLKPKGVPRPGASVAPPVAATDRPHDMVDMPGLLFLGHRRSEEHTSDLQSLMRISYAVFGSTKKHTHI